MHDAYELWDTPSGNLIDTYRSEDEAFAAVRAFVRAAGKESVVGVALMAHGSDGINHLIAEDADLLHVAREAQPA